MSEKFPAHWPFAEDEDFIREADLNGRMIHKVRELIARMEKLEELIETRYLVRGERNDDTEGDIRRAAREGEIT